MDASTIVDGDGEMSGNVQVSSTFFRGGYGRKLINAMEQALREKKSKNGSRQE